MEDGMKKLGDYLRAMDRAVKYAEQVSAAMWRVPEFRDLVFGPPIIYKEDWNK